MVSWENGEFYETNVKKKKLTIIKDGKELDLAEFHDELKSIVNECQIEKFEELKKTVLPLSKFFAGGVDEMHGFIMGFLVGAKFEREEITIKIEEIDMKPEERVNMNMIDMGILPRRGLED